MTLIMDESKIERITIMMKDMADYRSDDIDYQYIAGEPKISSSTLVYYFHCVEDSDNFAPQGWVEYKSQLPSIIEENIKGFLEELPTIDPHFVDFKGKFKVRVYWQYEGALWLEAKISLTQNQ